MCIYIYIYNNINCQPLQLQDEIETLRAQLLDKETELAGVKEALGITAFTEFRQSISNGLKVVGDKIKEVQDTETWVR